MNTMPKRQESNLYQRVLAQSKAKGGSRPFAIAPACGVVALAVCAWAAASAFAWGPRDNNQKDGPPPPLTELPDRDDARLPERAILRLGTLRLRDRYFASVAFSPDGKTLASAGGAVRLWDGASGRVCWLVENSQGHTLVAFSADGKKLAAAGGEVSKMSVWSLPEKKNLEFKTDAFGWGAAAICFSPDSKLLATGGQGYLAVYDAESGEVRYQFSGAEYRRSLFDAIAFSPDGKFFAYAAGSVRLGAAGDVDIRLCNPETGDVVRKLQGHKQKVWCLAFSPDGKKLAAASRDEPIRLWNVDDGKVIQEIPFTKADKLAFSPDGAKLAFGGMSMGEIHFWDVAAGKELLTIAGGTAYSLAFSPDGKRLAVANHSRAIGMWDANSAEELPLFAGHCTPVYSVAFSPNGKLLAGDGSILWHLPSGKLQRLAFACPQREGRGPGNGDSQCTMAFSSDGKQLIGVGGWDTGPNAFSVINAVSGERLFGIEAGRGRPWIPGASSVALAPDDDTVATASIYGVHLWSLASRKMVREFVLRPPENQDHQLPTDKERCAVFSPDGRTLAASDAVDHVVRLWDWKSGARLREIPVGAKFCDCMAFSPDGQLLAGCNPGLVCGWETATGKLLRKFGEARQGGARSVAFSADGRRIVVATKKSVDVWDVFTGEELSARDGHPLLAGGHRGDILCAAISPDGKTIASGSADTTILLWNAADLLPKTPVAALGPKALDRLWDDLRSDAPTAYKAIPALLGAPDKAIVLIKDRVPPAQKPDPKRIQALVADLDDNVVFVREAASKELGRLGEAAEPALRATLAGKPSSEVRSRCERLLESLGKGELDADGLRRLRAVQVLEHIGSAEARAVLKGLVGGAPGRLSREAKLALDVLDRRIP